jgi:hypothetical protein
MLVNLNPFAPLLFLLGLCSLTPLTASPPCIPPPPTPAYEFLLSTSSMTRKSCIPASLSDAVPCPSDAPPGQEFMVASVVACADTDSSSGADVCGVQDACSASPHFHFSCEVLACACDNEDDVNCIDCPPSRALSVPCSAAPITVPLQSSCLRLTSLIPPSFLGSSFSAHRSAMASDRIIFKLSSPACSVSGTHTHTTPALGPWVPGDLQRWHLAHASDDDYYAALDLAYTRVTLGDAWPDALCLDGSKGAYYM